ncbi:MAG: hypothetical protein IKN66_14245 [Ruminococcus sp.]|nr:hypothetical protein [Ruminococcus sp.]
MIKGNNKKPKNPNFPGWNNKLWQRIISLIIVFVFVTDTMFSGGLFGLLKFSTVLKAEAYNPTTPPSTFSGTSYSFSNDDSGRKQFADYCYYYSTDDGGTFCGAHKGDTLTLTFADLPESFQFMGIGNSSVPFEGTVQFLSTDSMSNISLPRALFSHVNAKAKITDAGGNDITLEITRNSTASSPLLADHVYGTGSGSWKIKVPSKNSNSFAGVIGQLEANASVTLEFENASTAVVSNTLSGENDIKDVGEICGIMKTGSSLTVTDTTATRTAVSSANGNAGSLVGSMEGSASLTLNSYPAFSSVSVTSGNGYAGGLVGKSSTSATITGLTSPLAIGGTVTGTEGAGGLYGYYTNTASSFDLKDYNITAAVSAENCGGVFGVLENTKGSNESVSLTIKNTGNAETVNVSSGSSASSGYFGSIAGKYTTDDLKNSLILDSFTVTAAVNSAFNASGGVLGYIDTAAYVKAQNLTVSASGAGMSSSNTFGGLIGSTSETSGILVDLGNFALSANDFKGGGVVGQFNKGVLRLSGTTDMSSGKAKDAINCGQLIGENNNVLVYALGNGSDANWTFKRSSEVDTDDLGTWGEVVRIAAVETNILTFDPTNHTVTVGAAVPVMSTQNHLVRTALNMQLDGCGCLIMPRTRNDVYSTNLSLDADISFAGTGVTGFMRDGGDLDDIGVFSGTLNGNGHTVTLAVGETYGNRNDAATSGKGSGQICRHQYNGLFSVLAGSVSDLKLDGNINVRNRISGMNIGCVAACNGGNVELSGITVGEISGSARTMAVNYHEESAVASSEDTSKNIGGLIGLVGNNGNVTVSGISAVNAGINFTGNHTNFNTYGGAIGQVTANTFKIDIGTAESAANKLTIGMNADVSGVTAVGADSNGGGLIGRIKNADSYSNRIVNVYNLEFNDCTVGNASSSNGGGFLGYSWFSTTANIKGLTVTSGTINNRTTNGAAGGNPNIGVMCYQATGRWNVNNLTVTKMSMSDGAGASLGMLVNKAYDGAKGLYLDVLKAGYTLTDKTQNSGITLPNTLGVYDELAAYSAADVIKGTTVGTTTNGAGVISINMNGGRHNPEADPADTYTKTKITETGTYQNQLTSASSGALGSAKYANANSRYYYNLDVMSKNDAEQNIMLWSVNHYAASNINGLFVSTSSPFSFDSETDVNLSDYSYYPVYSVSSLTLKNINLEFGYSGIYSLEGNSTFNTDSYNRDPGANNQHYLMQSGLFINGTEGSTLTLDTVKLSGDFLENSTYQGALFSGTTSGSINVNGLLLDGITPKYNNSGTISNYTGGYLLVKKVNRADAFKENIQLTLKDITTSDNYTVSNTTAAVSKSLFGDVYGPVIGINVSDVKLDARSSSSAVTGTSATALNFAYGTVNSIFTTATLFNKLETSQTATMIYNYSWDKDWGTGGNRSVTYGKEVSESVEYADKENKYYNDSRFTDPTNNNHTSEPEYDFSTNWLPYVATAYTANQTQDVNGCYYRELKVNVPATAYAQGCGTYNDPYIIDSGAKLQAIAALINDASKTDELPSLILPKTLYNGVEANTTGARWCDDKDDHAVYTFNGTDKYTSSDSDAEWMVDNVRLYLANAYYSLSAPTETSGYLELTDQYLGLGGTDVSGKYAFRGVIVGNSQTISNSSKNPLVKVSNGCVLKGLTVRQSVDVEVNAQDNAGYDNAYFGYNSACQYYGGLIGEIMGGDNIIDDSYVNFGSTTVTLTGSKGTIVPVGGYVGVIVYGGLIFKNIDARKTTIDQTHLNVVYNGSMGTTTSGINLASETKIVDGDTVKNHEAWAAIYVNPIVGRVINGYAVNETGGTAKDSTGASVTQFSVTEDGHYHDDDNSSRSGVTHTLQNGKKHYTIADLNPDLAKLDVTKVASSSEDGNIDVPNAQALFVLSLITQSAAGTAPTANGNDEGSTHTVETVETSRTTDPETGNVTINETTTITDIDTSLSNYANSLSYGTNTVGTDTLVYGMGHDAEYDDVGTDDDADDIDDYTNLASYDTAANTAIPYIIYHYTVGGTKNESSTTTDSSDVEKTRKATRDVEQEVTTYSLGGEFTPTDGSLDGQTLVIRGISSRTPIKYMTGSEGIPGNRRNAVVASDTDIANAAEIHFDKQSDGTYFLWCGTETNKQYLSLTAVQQTASIPNNEYKPDQRANLVIGTDPFPFNVQYNNTSSWGDNDNSYWAISGSVTYNNNDYIMYINYDSNNARLYYCGYISGTGNSHEFGQTNFDKGNRLKLYQRNATTTTETVQEEYDVSYTETTVTTTITTTSTFSYPARCVTTIAGYYNINLTGKTANGTVTPSEVVGEEPTVTPLTEYTYQLPDSFRGLGCVGIYDSIGIEDNASTANTNKFSMKIGIFDGKGCTIDEDIYINKFENDNYFNTLHTGASQTLSDAANNGVPYVGNKDSATYNNLVTNHGIGLFDSVIMIDDSKISDFTLTGSVNAEIFSNDYAASGELNGVLKKADILLTLWLCAGGVCGWSINNVPVNFESIDLDGLTVNGSNFVGGLLGYSAISSKDKKVTITKCSAEDISIIMSVTSQVGTNDFKQVRNGMGAFVGKVQEGAVVIYGTDHKYETDADVNDDLTDYSEVTIKTFEVAEPTLQYHVVMGGLVGFAGHCCQAYDIKVSSSDDTVTIGNSKVRFAGGIVGGMQSYNDKVDDSAVAKFINCTVENIDVEGEYAGGFYGGKWDSNWTPYSITLDNCKMLGKSTKNSITARRIMDQPSAGGFIGRGLVKTSAAANGSNILIKDCLVSNYNVTAVGGSKNDQKGVAGGFVGFCSSNVGNSSITCYIHDSSVEDCVIGATGTYSYGGGAIGWVKPQNTTASNRMLGYNIKLDNVTSNSGNNMGAWVGYKDSGKVSIQFTGMAIYGQGFSKNIGNNASLEDASFVFADYNGACQGSIPAGETELVYPTEVSSFNNTNNVDMPKYPYVNINPQSSMGTSGQGEEEISEIISGDAAVLNGSASETAAYSNKTAASTMALKIYEDLSDTSNSRRYTTFKDHNDTDAAKINEGYKIDEYMKRSVDDDGDRISTYYTEKDYTSKSYDDFACVVIANNTTQETTDLINRYAQLVTNTSTNYAVDNKSNDYFDIVVSPCKLQDGKFVIDTSEGAAPGLTYSKDNGQFSLDGAHADSLKSVDSFTLVDIQFKDPLNTTNVAYHLYIPVYTIKEIEITFSAAVMNGTNSVSYNVPAGTEAVNPYGAKLALATLDTQVDNLNTWYTTYIRYTYDRNDIIALLDSGNLNWSHNKYFYIDKTEHSATSMLPADTYMILVDPNGDHDKKYQVLLNATDFARTDVTIGSGESSYTTSRITFDFTKFKDSSATPAPFEVSTFNELIAKKIIPETVSGTGKYNSVEGTPSNINTGDKHYVYVKNDAGTPTYYEYVGTDGDTNLTLDDGEIYENYYVSMYVPGAANDTSFYGYYIRTPESFAAPSYESGTNNATPKSAKIDCHYGDNTSTVNRQVYIGNLFEQTTEFTVLPGDTEIDAGNHTLDVFATTTITPRSTNIVAILNAVHADIYHSFNLFLDRKGEDGKILNKIYDIKNDGNEIKAWYSVDTPISEGDDMDDYNSISTENIDRQDSYINVTTANIRKLGENGAESNLTADGVTIYSRVTLQFKNYMNEFPEKVAIDTGVSVRAASNLAYDTSSLAFSNMSASLEEPAATKHIYYRQSYSNATLNYYSKSELDCYDTDGSPSENYSKLGVSGLYSMNEYMPVNTTAQYNVQNIESTVEDADNLILTLSLQKKTDTPTGGPYTAATYQNVSSINEYWGAVVRDGTTHEVTPNTKGEPVTSSGTNLRIKCGTYDEIKTVAANTQTFTVTIPKATNGVPGFTYDGSGYIEIDIDFNAKTGADFTEYANYKVNLSVMLMDGAEDIAGSYAPDYLIYTNAKVNHEFLKH